MFRKKKRVPAAQPVDSRLLIDVRQLSKIYHEGKENEVRALDNISLQVPWGQFLCILGQSGSGKSTLMNILGCLDIPDLRHLPSGRPGSERHAPIGAGRHPQP